VRLGAGDAAALSGAGVSAAHCPRSNEHLRVGRAPLGALRDAGVRVGLGTDSPASGGDYDVRAEARACVAAGAGGSPDWAALLRLATLGGAEALGLEGEVGTLTPGTRADLVALRPTGPVGDPHRAALDSATRVDLVVVAGEPLVSDGRPALIDAERVDARANESRERLW
jgi:5-methylthioadenosine/S-adenosylhomocysteine deaminase